MSYENLLRKSFGYLKCPQLYTIRHLKKSDKKEVIKIISWFFYESYVHKSMRLNKISSNKAAEFYVESFAFNKQSVGIFENKTHKIVGIGLINEINYGPQCEKITPPAEIKYHLSLQKFAEGKVIIGKPQEYGKFMSMKMLLVYPEYSASGIGREVVNYGVEVAKMAKCRQIGATVSSEISLKMFRGLDFKVHKKFNIDDFVYPETGFRPFTKISQNHKNYYYIVKDLT